MIALDFPFTRERMDMAGCDCKRARSFAARSNDYVRLDPEKSLLRFGGGWMQIMQSGGANGASLRLGNEPPSRVWCMIIEE
jgi:hypothetical protein